ncbi:MAG: rhomboid family intramembrane serine protease [Taibaiella sp.]|nr:rhomboid family intramembrane serine protease [Taibaiella sp.]
MKPFSGRSPLSYIPGYSRNSVIQLIVASGVGYVSIQLVRICILMFTNKYDAFYQIVIPDLALPALPLYKTKVWTLLTYGWVHLGFWELFSNMIWLYCFGNLVQVMVGYKQVIPLFIYSLISGGIFYLLCQLIPGLTPVGGLSLLGCQAGLMGLAAAAVTLTPTYRFYIGPTFSLPLPVIAGVFALLMLMNTHLMLPLIFLLLGGALCGFVFIKLLRNGYKPGEWAYNLLEKMEKMVTPGNNVGWNKNNKKRNQVLNTYSIKNGISQKRVDELLDKINQKGYNSLSAEEKDLLTRAGKDK